MIVYGQISSICLHANEGHESKTKDSVYNAYLNFKIFFSGKKVRIKYGNIRYYQLSCVTKFLVQVELFTLWVAFQQLE